jgi:bifunctional non-homologous end joining protein LigD
MSDQPLTVVRIIAPDFVATFETADGVVRRADSAIAYLVGWTDGEVREFVYSKS